jgi:Nickel responsive protein SCO4226-like
MPKYVIEREIPGVGKLSAKELQTISQKSCDVRRELGPQIQWIHSYVTRTRSTVCTLHPMKTQCESTRGAADFRPTAFLW